MVEFLRCRLPAGDQRPTRFGPRPLGKNWTIASGDYLSILVLKFSTLKIALA